MSLYRDDLRDDLFFRQFLNWYIGKTIYIVIMGRVSEHWWDIGPWLMPKIEKLIIEKITITKHGVYINDSINVYDECLYIDKEEADAEYQSEKYYYNRKIKRTEDEFENYLKETGLYELFYR